MYIYSWQFLEGNTTITLCHPLIRRTCYNEWHNIWRLSTVPNPEVFWGNHDIASINQNSCSRPKVGDFLAISFPVEPVCVFPWFCINPFSRLAYIFKADYKDFGNLYAYIKISDIFTNRRGSNNLKMSIHSKSLVSIDFGPLCVCIYIYN